MLAAPSKNPNWKNEQQKVCVDAESMALRIHGAFAWRVIIMFHGDTIWSWRRGTSSLPFFFFLLEIMFLSLVKYIIIWVMREIKNHTWKSFFTNKYLDFTNDIKYLIYCHLTLLTDHVWFYWNEIVIWVHWNVLFMWYALSDRESLYHVHWSDHVSLYRPWHWRGRGSLCSRGY